MSSATASLSPLLWGHGLERVPGADLALRAAVGLLRARDDREGLQCAGPDERQRIEIGASSGSTPSFLSSTAPRSVVRWMMRAFASMYCGTIVCRGA